MNAIRKIYIYGLRDPFTSEIRYVGKTVNLNRRYNSHISRCNESKRHSANWIRSIIQAGSKPILFIIEETSLENWQDRETFWINYYRNLFDLTNITDGGKHDCVSRGRLGKKNSPEHIAKCIASRTGKPINQNDKNGRRRAGIIQYNEKRKKPVLQYTIDGVFIKEWPSAVDAAKELSCNHANITVACKQPTRTAMQCMWRFKCGVIEEKIDAYVKPQPSNKNKPLSNEIKAKISASKKGKSWSSKRRDAQNYSFSFKSPISSSYN